MATEDIKDIIKVFIVKDLKYTDINTKCHSDKCITDEEKSSIVSIREERELKTRTKCRGVKPRDNKTKKPGRLQRDPPASLAPSA